MPIIVAQAEFMQILLVLMFAFGVYFGFFICNLSYWRYKYLIVVFLC